MCGRVRLLSWDETFAVARRLQAQATYDEGLEWSGQARPGSLLPAFISSASGNGADTQLSLSRFTWGYPFPDTGKLVYNSRIESAGSPLWAESFAAGRSFVAIDAFFEPHHSETERNPHTGRMGKRAYEFCTPDGSPLLLGAVTHNGRISIVTTEPNASVAPVHPRMPLVLSFEEVPLWLGGEWPHLADRSAVELSCAPEHPSGDASEQLSLF